MYVLMVYSINNIYTVSSSNRITLMCREGDAHHMYVCSWHGVLGKNVLCKLKFLWMFRGYYVRWKAVDHCVRKFLQITEKCPERQVSCQRIVQSVFLEAGHLAAIT